MKQVVSDGCLFFSVHGKALESLQMDQYQNRKMPGPKMDIEAPEFVK